MAAASRSARAPARRRGGRRRAARGGRKVTAPAEGERPWAGRRIHLVGVGGAGMSAYARAAHALGAELSGSDAAEGEQTRALAAEGVLRAAIGHDAANVPAGEDVELYYSSAIPPANPERAAARERGLARAAARRPARRALGAAAHDRRRRHPRQDDDRLDARRRSCAPRASTPAGSSARRSAAASRTRTGAPASGSSSRRTSRIARC